MAASAAEVDLTCLSPPPSPLGATPRPPNPPATIAGMERFIALAIRLVRIEPEAPTIMPATIIAVLFSAKPAAAADRPVEPDDHRGGDRRAQQQQVDRLLSLPEADGSAGQDFLQLAERDD